ncbi:MAG: ATP-binding protein [Syntrophomonadaceae bacterium]|nr:ATP-binding protein [Syntrophomonadaceae bacterium]
MLKSYRWKLLSAYLLIITILLSLLGGVVFVKFKNYYLSSLEERLVKEAFLVADMTKYRSSNDNETRSFQDICNLAAQDSAARITIIDDNGVVLGDSSAQSETMEIHNSRPEVYAALHGEIGIEIRYSDTLKINMLYVAVPFDSGDSNGAVRIAMPLSELQAIYKNLLSTLLGAFFLCGLLAAIISLILAEYFSHPLKDITMAVRDMAAGNLKRRTSYRSDDEMGELARAFNDMGQHIEKSMCEVSEVKQRLEALLNNTVNGIVMIGTEGKVNYVNPAAAYLLGLRDDYIGRQYIEVVSTYELLDMIDEARNTMQAVKRSIILHTLGARTIEVNVVPIRNQQVTSQDILLVLNDITEIKRLEKVRKDFIANVSHELKTPVATISGFAETLLDEGGKSPENVMEFTQIIYDEARRLSLLINDLLELSKLESDESSLNMQVVDLGQLVRKNVDRMIKVARLRSINIEYNQPAQSIELVSDINSINQILTNLLDNAIKYSLDEGRIEVKLEEMDDRVKISISDKGIGIPAKEINRIFERFYRVDKARSRKTGGTGLGLAIVKHLVENLGGQVTVESNLGLGSTFSFTLPNNSLQPVSY